MEEYDRKGVVIMSAIDKLIQIANAEVGYLEKSSNSQLDSKTANAGTANYTKYWRDIKPEYQGQPWCACFVTWCFVNAFGKNNAQKLLKHYPYVYCPTMANLFTLNANPKVGDIVIIYRTGERYPKRYSSVVTGIAIIEEIIRTKDVDDCIKICKDRSIFSEEEIKVLQPKYPVVVRLLDYATLKNKVSLNQLYKNQIIVEGSGPRPFQQLNKEEYTIIYNLGMGENL